eukprot:scaffold23077_cov68-Phaeocystis_antarctica.AAC.2
MEARVAARGVAIPATASLLSDRWTSCRRRKWGAAGWAPPAGHAGSRCARRRRREGGRGVGARYRTVGAPSRPAAAPCALPVPSFPRPLSPPGVACPPPAGACSGVSPAPSPRSCGVGASRPSAPRQRQRPANSRWPSQPRRRRR